MAHDTWWRHAVIYQVYIRSFADGNGDGIGDIAGIRAHLGHIADLGVDAIWITPWYPSPMADAGYDVADYRDIEPIFGTLAEAEAMIDEAHQLGLRVILDIVPNHSSDRHAWFQQALAAGPGSPERERYLFRDGRGEHGELAPNDWQSCFHGPAWTRVTEADGSPGQWYEHLFAPEQPDLNWDNPEIRADFERTLAFWFDRGVDGFRIDVAHSLLKEPGLPDIGERHWPREQFRVTPIPGVNQTDHPHWDRDEVHDVYRGWRRVADAYDPPRVFVAEAVVPDVSRMALYLRGDELHTAFNFDYGRSAWRAADLREVIVDTLREHAAVDAPPTWMLSNHDIVRHVSRYGRLEQRTGYALGLLAADVDLELGRRRARAATMLMLALPGSAYVYQGEELGLAEVEDLPGEVRQDPTWARSGFTDPGRDGCRVPLPWTSDGSSFGFGPDDGAAPWLPQPSTFGPCAADAQRGVDGSFLELYRSMLRLRAAEPALGDGDLTWIDAPADVLAFRREPGFVCIANLGSAAVALPDGAEVLLLSGALDDDGTLPSDTTAWLRG